MSKKIELSGHLAIELKTIEIMTEFYCKHHHKNDCLLCEDFVTYVSHKLDRCVYGQAKPACQHCPVHCYKPKQKSYARNIMRFSGPKMIFIHPLLAIKHLLKSRKKFPEKIPNAISNYHLRKKTKP